jgi:hypothetical protein
VEDVEARTGKRKMGLRSGIMNGVGPCSNLFVVVVGAGV